MLVRGDAPLGFTAKYVPFIALLLGLLALVGAPTPSRADDCSSLLGMINTLKAHIPNEPRDAANDDRAVLNQYVGLYNAKCTGGSSAGRSAPPPGPSDAARQRCTKAYANLLGVMGFPSSGAVDALRGGDCTRADDYRRDMTRIPEAILDAVEQCDGIETITVGNRPMSVAQAEADLAEARENANTAAMQCLINGLGRPAPEPAPRSAMAPSQAKPHKPAPDDEDGDNDKDDGPVPKELLAAMQQCLADGAKTGMPIDTPREAMKACDGTDTTLLSRATAKQIQDAFVFAKYDRSKPPPPRTPKPTTTAGFPNTNGACVAWTNPRRTLCAGDDPGTRNCSCVTYHNTCSEMVTVYYSVIGANSSPGVLTLNHGDSGPACTGRPNESIQYQSTSIVPGGKF